MAVILSLQGCMAVGTTTAVQYVKERRPEMGDTAANKI